MNTFSSRQTPPSVDVLIAQAKVEEWTSLNLSNRRLTTLPETLSQLTRLQTLDLRNNRLKVLPEWLSQLTRLQTLDLRNNRLKALPEWLSQLTHLQTLFLGANQLTMLPESLKQLSNLQRLDLRDNRMSVLPEWLEQLTNLQRLYLSSNLITDPPEWLGKLTNLQLLYLSGYQLKELPEWLRQLTNLQTLDLSGNHLRTLPDWFGELTNLQVLNLNNNWLKVLPEWLCQLTDLHTLDIRRNRLKVVPEWLGQLTNLRSLYLAGNQFTTLPERLGQLANLQRLDLGNTQLTMLPEWLGLLNSLQLLYLNSNQLTTLPEWLGQLTNLQTLDLSGNQFIDLPGVLEQLTNLQTLYLSRNRLRTLPEWLGQLTNLQSLYLSSNKLTELPEWLGQLTNLQSLYLSGNQLTKLPEWLGQLTNLQSLYLSGHQFEELPESLGQLTSLRMLYLGRNQLTELPGWLEQLTNLQRLDLGGNQLTALPEWLGQLTNLQWLDLGRNQLTALPEWLGQLTSLQSLDLSNNKLTVLPESLGQLTNLQLLDLGGNQLTMLPEWLGQLTNLQTLDIGNNQLTALPKWLEHLIDLRRLNLRANQLTELPEWLGQLTNLQFLDLSNNQLATLPEWLGQLTRLKTLDLGDNQLTALPKWLRQLTRLQTLDLRINRLRVLPEWLGQLTSLQRLYLGNNQLTVLPEAIGKLTDLQWLELTANQLTVLPKCLGQLTDLQQLQLSNNQLMVLPEWLGQLTDLQQLDLRNNHLTTLPEWFGQLPNLQSLYLGKNQLTMLPEWPEQLTRLQMFDLSSNHLATLPEWIGQLLNLRILDLSKNQFTTLPEWLGQLPNLQLLDLDDNPLDPTVQSAYDADLDSLRAYLQSLATPGQRELLYEAKLVLVGEGGVGKTSLLKALTGGVPQLHEGTTHGVQIERHALHLPHPDNTAITMQFNAWDFGGQEVYRVTHQFFFSPRSVYLLVWEPRRGVQQCQVDDWLKLLRLRVGDDARVLIVSTHAQSGERIARIDKPVLLRDYGSMIVDFLEVDSFVDDPETGDKLGLAALKTKIAIAAANLEQMGMAFNRNWRAARDTLLALNAPRISLASFYEHCNAHGLDATAARTLAILMHDLGYIVYYADDERLCDDVVLQPDWLTKAIGFVLEDRGTADREGLLPDSALRGVWQEHPYPNEPRYGPELYPFFLRLMERFDVSYRLEDGTASLVAQHVPQVRPPLPWLPEEDIAPDRRRLAMMCQMEEVPPGLVPWMIVRTHDYNQERPSVDGIRRRLHWQRGMFLRYKGNGEAFIELRDRELQIHVEAGWPEYFMNVLRQTLTTLITETWPGMEGRYTFRVPCQARKDGQACTGSFGIDALRDFHAEGDTTVRCEVCRQRQKIEDLLYGFEEEDSEEMLARIEAKVDAGLAAIAELESRVSNVMFVLLRALADEAKTGPRLFTLEPADGNWRRPFTERYRLRLWCEMDGCQHPVIEYGQGEYEVPATREWVLTVAPYANFVIRTLKMVVPVVGPAANIFLGQNAVDEGLKNRLDLAKESTDKVLREMAVTNLEGQRSNVLNEGERRGLLALHAMLRQVDPHHQRLGLRRIITYTGDYRWLCPTHYAQWESKIPETIG